MDDDYSFEVPQVNFQQIDEEVDQQQLNQFFGKKTFKLKFT